MRLHTIILGFSVIMSCVFLADALQSLGVREAIGDVPLCVFVALCGLVLMWQGWRSTPKRRR